MIASMSLSPFKRYCLRCSLLFPLTYVLSDQALDQFCLLADTEETLPPLASGKKWANYRLSTSEWRLIRLAHHCLNVCGCHWPLPLHLILFFCSRFLQTLMVNSRQAKRLHVTRSFPYWRSFNHNGRSFSRTMNTNKCITH